MAGHNKWSKVKRIKAVLDVRKGKVFSRLAKEITLAARAGGDPAANPRLRTLMLKAREANMPGDNVDRAIKKGTGELAGQTIEELTYEGYGPGGVALVIQVATDNKNRAASDVRATFNDYGGNLAGAGAVMFQFRHCSQFLIPKAHTTEDALMELALDAGADDVRTSEEGFEIIAPVSSFDRISAALEAKNIKADSSEIVYLATVTMPVTDADVARSFSKLRDALEELDDVQAVFSNEEFSDVIAAQVE